MESTAQAEGGGGQAFPQEVEQYKHVLPGEERGGGRQEEVEWCRDIQEDWTQQGGQGSGSNLTAFVQKLLGEAKYEEVLAKLNKDLPEDQKVPSINALPPVLCIFCLIFTHCTR